MENTLNLENILLYGVNIEYKPVVEMPVNINEPTGFQSWAAPGIAQFQGTKLMTSGKKGLYSAKTGQFSGLVYRSVEPIGNGLNKVVGKKSVRLMASDGTMLTDDCDDVKDVGEGCYAVKKGGLWAVFRIDGNRQITDYRYTEIGEASEESIAVRQKEGWQLIDTEGQLIFNEFYQVCKPFTEGVAMVGDKKALSYIERNGNVLFSGARKLSRPFCNGYAVFCGDWIGHLGVIDRTGKVVCPAEYLFIQDASYGMFVVAKTGTVINDGIKSSSFGLISASGKELLPLTYTNIEVLSENLVRYGNIVSWSFASGNTTYTLGVYVFGAIDANGKEILPRMYVQIGDESEGLRAFKTFSGTKLRFGYMLGDGTEAFEIGEIDYSSFIDPQRTLLREDIAAQLKPFSNGRALVCIKMGNQNVRTFRGMKTVYCAEKVDWYAVNKDGKQISVSNDPSIKISFDFKQLPFYYASQKTGLSVKIEEHPFGDMKEMVFSYGFAIVDGENKVICSSYEGSDSPDRLQLRELMGYKNKVNYDSLTKIADNVWRGVKDGKEKFMLSEFESPCRFSCGLAPYRAGNGLWGYMDIRGNAVVPPQYTRADCFEDGYAYAERNGTPVILHRELSVTERNPQ